LQEVFTTLAGYLINEGEQSRRVQRKRVSPKNYELSHDNQKEILSKGVSETDDH